MAYTHLTLELRKKIEFLYHLGRSHAYMALRLGVSRSTLSRELRRNASGKTYNAHAAHKQAMLRKKRPQGVLQENRPKGSGDIIRLSLSVSESLMKKKPKKNYYAPKDTSIRMARNKVSYPFSGKSLHTKRLLSLEQKNKRRLYLQKRKRNHILESLLRGSRIWWTIISSVLSQRNKKRHFRSVKMHTPSQSISLTPSPKKTTKNPSFKRALAAPSGRLRQAENILYKRDADFIVLSERENFRPPP